MMLSKLEKQMMRMMALAGALSGVYFCCHAWRQFRESLESHATIRQEADILMSTVCTLPRSEFPGNFVDCSAVKTAASGGGSGPLVMSAIESTTDSLLQEMIRSIKSESLDIIHALGMTTFVVCGLLGIMWLYVHRALHLQYINSQKTAYSPYYQSRQAAYIDMSRAMDDHNARRVETRAIEYGNT